MGNPLWYKNASSEYYKIRDSIKFNDLHYGKSNTYKGIDYENTLLVHWRRGDFKLTNLADEEETKEYYKNYNNLNSLENISKNILLRCFENKITSVFLLTNETNEEELKKLSYILSEFNINLIMYGSSNDNNYLKYVTNDICGIIIGSKCKYQLYTGSYDRMSQYGRWIQEEYLDKLAHAKFGLCMAGFGLKCNREIECMALGTVPVVAPDVDMSCYSNPPQEDIHYIRLKTWESYDALMTIDNISQERWESMSLAAQQWYKENSSVEGLWNLTQKLATF
jgi:hypothetical protein